MAAAAAQLSSAAGPSTIAALGIISATTSRGATRRDAARSTWLRLGTGGFAVRFILRCGKLSASNRASLQAKEGDDVVCIDEIPYDEGRLRGPILSLAWWFAHALEQFPTAKFVCKSDSDVFLNLPDLTLHLEAALAHNATTAQYAYYGNFGFFSLVDRAGLGPRRHVVRSAVEA